MDFFRGSRPWTQLFRLLDRLPRHSHYKAALVNDATYAAAIVSRNPEGLKSGPPPLTEWSPEVELLAQAVDAMRETVARLVWAHSRDHRKPDVKNVKRPRTAINRAERIAFEQRAAGWLAQLIPQEMPGQ